MMTHQMEKNLCFEAPSAELNLFQSTVPKVRLPQARKAYLGGLTILAASIL